MTDVFKIADILVSHAVRVHGDEIALIVYLGSYATGTAKSTSDLDIYYVPDDGKAESLSTTFVIGGLPFEFESMPWKVLENIANAKSRNHWAVSASQIADAKVLYHRSDADLERFNALKARIAELDPTGKPWLHGRTGVGGIQDNPFSGGPDATGGCTQ